MQAVQFSRFGPGAEVAELVDVPDPGPPGPGEVLIDLLAAPINPSELLNFEGRYGAAPPALPAFSGGEAVGRVSALGEGVRHLKVGDRVLTMSAGRGTWRERIKARAEPLFALPAGADVLQLAMLAVNPATAWNMLTQYVSLRPGDWVLQNAANSAVGHNVIKLAKTFGAHTLNVVRREDQIAPLLAAGGDVALADGPDLVTQVAEATGNAPIVLALDAVVGDSTGKLANCLAPGGTLVIYGLLSGNASRFDAADVLFRKVSIRGFWLSAWFANSSAAERKRVYERLTALIADGTIRVPIEATYPLARVKEALAHAARPRSGKILLVMNE
ncbi:MAG TPA: zinc-dependent alcohol dehydrogenase family protein [Xanthobacteraceae bacterium]|nr:zinc-dependent alcohol dehydrogenase family protein [Xanthobacteraceae bacterium]